MIKLASKYNSVMQKSLFLLIPLILWGCEKTFDNVIDVSTENYQVTSVTHKDSYDLKNPGDSVLTARIKFTRVSQLGQVFFNVIASDNSALNPAPIEMFDISDNLFSAQFILKREYPNGTYTLNFIAKGTAGLENLVATSSFGFNNGQDNVAPFLSNLTIPDSIPREESFIFNVEAFDSNGLSDIKKVFFELYRPDGTIVEIDPGSGLTEFLMHDDGNFEIFGDSVAGDGIYSFKNSFAVDAQTGSWKFVFQAEDRSDTFSNIIEHFMIVY